MAGSVNTTPIVPDYITLEIEVFTRDGNTLTYKSAPMPNSDEYGDIIGAVFNKGARRLSFPNGDNPGAILYIRANQIENISVHISTEKAYKEWFDLVTGMIANGETSE